MKFIRNVKRVINNPKLISKFIKETKDSGLKVAIHKVTNYTTGIDTYKQPVSLESTKFKTIESLKSINYLPTLRGEDVAFTIISKNYLHVALTLRDSFLKYNPEHKFVIWIVDMITDNNELKVLSDLTNKGVDFVFWCEVASSHLLYKFEQMFFKYSIMEMNTAIKPFILEYYIKSNYRKIYYIDPDIYFYSPIVKLQRVLEDFDIVLTPHMMHPYEDDKAPSDQDILQAGSYNLGFIAIKSSIESLKLCVWWKQKLFQSCFVDLANGLFVDQKWMDLTPSLFNNVFIFKDFGHNVAYWNIHERQIIQKNNSYFVNNDELVFFHFSGLTFDNVSLISKHQSRYNLSMLPKEYNDLFLDYAARVKNNNSSTFKKMRYYYNYVFGTDIALPSYLRRTMLEDIFSIFNNPFVFNNSYYRNICSIFSEKMNLIMYYYWVLRGDLQEAFPDIQNNQASLEEYTNWWSLNNAGNELLDIKFAQASDLIESFLGLSCVGYFQLQTGVAEVGRNFVKTLLKNGVSTNIITIDSEHHAKISNSDYEIFHSYKSDKLYKNQIFFINADQINNVIDSLSHINTDKYSNRIGVFWWEFNDYFNFEAAFKNLNKVVVFTDFIKSAVDKVAPRNIEVIKLLYPYQIVSITSGGNIIADKFFQKNSISLGKDFIFYFNFDMRSCFERKNPMAILEAFSIVSLKCKNIKLILKISNTEGFENELSLINIFINNHGLLNVIIDKDLYDKNDMLGIIKCCNCYISLHRSEGLGLGMLDAMSLGLPVIATNYGGNTDFMNEDNSVLINYKLCEVKEDFGSYKRGYVWADPDINHAAEKMQYLVENKDVAHELGERARSYVKNKFSDINLQKNIYSFVKSLYEE